MNRFVRSLAAGALLAGGAGVAVPAQDMMFGGEEDIAYSQALWDIMEGARLVGASSIMATPYDGGPPHGMMLETFYTTATVDGHTGDLIVKRNYGPEGVTAGEILADPATHLAAVTIMFRREQGYDADNADWFWAKYLPDGTLDKTPTDMQMAGRVAKGADTGCIACHSGVDDYIFTADHIE